MKKSILNFSKILLFVLGFPMLSFSQEVASNQHFNIFDNNDHCVAMVLPVTNDEATSLPEKEGLDLVSGAKLMKLKSKLGHLPIDFEEIIQSKIALLSNKIDCPYSLPFTKISIDLSLDAHGKAKEVMIDGNKLDEHLIKELEDTIIEWQFVNSKLEGELNIMLELILI